jgi:hypothetical protein
MSVSKATQRDKKTQFIAGIQKHFGKQKTVTLKGQVVNLPGLVTKLQASIAAGKDTDSKRVIYLEAAETSREADAAVNPTMLVLTDFLQTTMAPIDLADFGIQPKKRAVPSVATKAVAAEKSRATRKARGTMGKKAKLKIVGVVPPAPSSTPAVAPKAASPNGAGTTAPATTTSS